jgi:DNA-binding transcriptional regulator GbsR (MarR family)
MKKEMPKSPKSEFIDLMTENSKVNGLDELSSRIIGILFIEPEEIALDELAKRTGYSLSAISTAMKFIERAGIVKRSKKPKSRKVYFYMEKDILATWIRLMRRKYENIILPSKYKLPKIIERYKQEKSENLEVELRIVEDYYRQVLYSEQLIKDSIKTLELYEYEVNK